MTVQVFFPSFLGSLFMTLTQNPRSQLAGAHPPRLGLRIHHFFSLPSSATSHLIPGLRLFFFFLFFPPENVARKTNLCFQFGEIYEGTEPTSVRMYTQSEFGGVGGGWRFTTRRSGRNSKFTLTYITFSMTEIMKGNKLIARAQVAHTKKKQPLQTTTTGSLRPFFVCLFGFLHV